MPTNPSGFSHWIGRGFNNWDEVKQAVADVIAHGVTPEEIEKARTLRRMGVIEGQETADSIAGNLADEAIIGGDPNRVNEELAKIDAVTPGQPNRFADIDAAWLTSIPSWSANRFR